ncbi:hybrid sensor histidine kinase/response regulator [Cytobacillus gottheilii]|uniref:hybrid sensor histidine kinase/response regulator n=1 Tax=Cytobacillus gottheilii TaxID=859144 RepID=UPI0009BBCF6A|nr:ATP-binding protein [Cytobacillus gottheilii]
MKKKNLLFLVGLFVILLILARAFWIMFNNSVPDANAVNGIVHLDHLAHSDIAISGEWEFYSGEIISNNHLLSEAQKKIVEVEDRWYSSKGYGTYRLMIYHNQQDHANGLYSIRFPSVRAKTAIYINGEYAGGSGKDIPESTPYHVQFPLDGDHTEVIVHVKELGVDMKKNSAGGILFGKSEFIEKNIQLSSLSQIAVVVVLLLHGLYVFLLYLIGFRSRALLFFVMLMLSASLMVLISDDRLLISVIPLTYTELIKSIFSIYTCTALFLFLFIRYFLLDYKLPTLFNYYPYLCGAYIVFIFITPVQTILNFSFVLGGILFISGLAALIQFAKLVISGREDVVFLFFAAAAVLNNVIWSILKYRLTADYYFYPFDIMAAVILFSVFWLKSYVRKVRETEILSAELLKSNKQKDDFLANTSHELRNPLHGILGITESLLKKDNNTNLQLILDIGRKMSLLLDDLLDFTRLKEKGIVLHIEGVRLQPAATGVIDMLKHMNAGKRLEIKMSIDDDFPSVAADERRLIQIIYNLVHNALKFTDTGLVEIRAEYDETKATIFVSDTGIGMDMELQNRIFQPYEQGDPSITSFGGGIGLGLSICKELIHLHGGELSVRSVPGEGSTFSFTMPVAAKEELVTQSPITVKHSKEKEELLMTPAAAEEGQERTASILVVDDDPVNGKVLVDLLSSEEYKLTTVLSGEDALERLNEKWDLIISDVMMPKMSGYELTRRIRERYSISDLPILLLTARNRPEDKYAGFQAGANDYVSKPVEILELQARVNALVHLKLSVQEHLRVEAAWLQAQIRPHFLFNTLNTVLYLQEEDPDKMRAVLEAFIVYLQSSFDFQNSMRLVPIQYELELVKAYLFIQQERFQEKLEVNWEVEEELHVMIPPLSIQPIVENAIQHGILPSKMGGKLLISITRESEEVSITVSDNGVGMTQQRMTDILSDDRLKNRGVGVYNTNLRLKKLYGTGLKMTSGLGQGTTISFRVKNER